MCIFMYIDNKHMYRDIINDLLERKLVYFRKVKHTTKENLET
jgi:hypothetical protein